MNPDFDQEKPKENYLSKPTKHTYQKEDPPIVEEQEIINTSLNS